MEHLHEHTPQYEAGVIGVDSVGSQKSEKVRNGKCETSYGEFVLHWGARLGELAAHVCGKCRTVCLGRVRSATSLFMNCLRPKVAKKKKMPELRQGTGINLNALDSMVLSYMLCEGLAEVPRTNIHLSAR